MQTAVPRALSRKNRVQEICAQLRELVALSLEQRRTIDRLLGELEAISRSAGGSGGLEAALPPHVPPNSTSQEPSREA
jgi:hypothetical protein